MRVTGLRLSRYRTFREPQALALAPLTIIIGKNGSGKSVLTRLPLLLADAVSRDPAGPLNLSAGGVDHAASFQDLVNMRGALPFMLGAEIGDGQERRSFEATLRYVNETKSVAIERFELFSGDATLCKIEISNADQLVSQAPTYNVIANGLALQDMPVKFAGLFPTAEHEQLSGILAEAHAIFSQAFTMPSYLGPFRAEPTRTMRQPSQNIRDLGPRGERALEFLADDRLRRGGQLSARVGEWFGQALGQSVHVDVTGEQPQIVVRPNNTELDISLADTGAGFSQSLPVVVQNLAFQDNRLPASMLIVEQPELHFYSGWLRRWGSRNFLRLIGKGASRFAMRGEKPRWRGRLKFYPPGFGREMTVACPPSAPMAQI